MSRVVVTGVAGFVGSHVAEALVAGGHDVVGLDAFIPYYPRDVKEANLAGLRAGPRFAFHELDLRRDDLEPVLDGADAIIHEAAMAGLPRSWTEFDSYLTCNVQATQRLVEAALAASVARFVHISTSSVYGLDATGDETGPTRPISPYGVTKLAAEHLVGAYRDTHGLPALVLRYFSIFGPRQRPDMGYNLFIEALLDDRPITIFGDGEQSRTNTYVADAAAATVAALERGELGAIYNIGGGESITVNEAIAVLAEHLGVEPRIEHGPPRAGDQRHTRAETGRARAALGFAPTVGPHEGLRAQADWQRRRRA
ncbi:MAG TPA: NAD-dependent epimerase/dehydratase family protein [Candidatus Limnocylindrales bacterium]|nr:NAD-dependent epimerase/dehydratase family protein [Candidatus Limnocylindrales bacterium]